MGENNKVPREHLTPHLAAAVVLAEVGTAAVVETIKTGASSPWYDGSVVPFARTCFPAHQTQAVQPSLGSPRGDVDNVPF